MKDLPICSGRIRVSKTASAFLTLLFALASHRVSATTGDPTFLGVDYGAPSAEALARQSVSALAESARALAANFSVIADEQGETLLPPGTTCDTVEIADGLMTARFTLPGDLAPGTLDPSLIETAGEILRVHFLESAALTGIALEARLGPDGDCRPMEEFEAVEHPAPRVDTTWMDGVMYRLQAPFVTAPAPSTPERDNVTGAGPVGQPGTQPTGALSGRVVYLYGMHGWTYYSGYWHTQRSLYNGMVEDYGNFDQENYFAHHCFNAGATVVPLRPVDYQPNEVVIDNDKPGFSIVSGVWTEGTSTPYFGEAGDAVKYRVAAASPTESAVVRYTPSIPETGFYPVYTWALGGSNRADQLYRVVHSGGTTLVHVDHRRVGSGWVWLGTYHFGAGTSGHVDISDESSTAGGYVIADAIRFGNGMGDVSRGGSVSGFPRTEEANRYWLERSNGQGGDTEAYDKSSTDDYGDSINAPPRTSSYMNLNSNYYGQALVGFHSNGSNGSARGCVALVYTAGSERPPSQDTLATLLANELDADCTVEDANWEYTWVDRSSPTLAGTYGEISASNLGYFSTGPEMCATLVEVAFHDNAQDAALMRDGRVRSVMGRACMQGLIRYFHQFDGGPLAFPPEPPTNLRVINSDDGQVTISWQAPPAGGAGGDAATGYRVYRSTDGYGFDAGVSTAATSITLDDLTPGTTYFFRVAATNAGGESMPTETLGARVTAAGPAPILVVNGFDRFDRLMDVSITRPTIGGAFDIIPYLHMNTYDYTVQHGQAIAAADRYFDSTSNEALIAGQVALGDYDIVVWILGEESKTVATRDATFGVQEQTLLTNYLSAGGKLFVSGAEIGYDLQAQGNGPTFLQDTLRTLYAANDAGVYTASGVSGSIFDGLGTLTFDNGSLVYNVDTPDTLQPSNGSVACLRYTGAGNPVAGLQYPAGTGGGQLVVLAFPFETITGIDTRNAVMQRVLDFFGSPLPPELSAIMWR